MDQTIAMFADPYRYISKNCRQKNSDSFETRIFMKDTICLTGPAAAEEVFYNEDLIIRHGASPGMLKATLLGKGGVQDLDDKEHIHRKAMFMSIMTPENVSELGRIVTETWETYLPAWQAQDKIVLYEDLRPILTEAVCKWAGVPLRADKIEKRSKELTALFDAAGSKNILRHLYSRYSRKKLDAWMIEIVRDIRKNSTQVITPAQVFALHRDLKGKLLDEHTAAVEILNIIRPVVAVSLFMTFTAHALNLHPESKLRLQHHEIGYTDWFVSEVRRLYPFFPTAMGKARKDFNWRGQKFTKGMQVLFDVYGTNHDPRTYDAPLEFFPERFRNSPATAFNFVPQGAGDHNVTHRCPGEFITIELMKVATEFLTLKMDYELPEQDLAIDFKRTPAKPKSGFVMTNISEVYPTNSESLYSQESRQGPPVF